MLTSVPSQMRPVSSTRSRPPPGSCKLACDTTAMASACFAQQCLEMTVDFAERSMSRLHRFSTSFSRRSTRTPSISRSSRVIVPGQGSRAFGGADHRIPTTGREHARSACREHSVEFLQMQRFFPEKTKWATWHFESDQL